MPLQNRMSPFGSPVDHGRGLLFGNRGCLHDDARRIVRPYRGTRWIACRLDFRGRHRSPLMQPGRYTELFFLDEATALAAGHRPCRECRYADHRAFLTAWRDVHPEDAGVPAMDARLHAERVDPRRQAQRRHRRPWTGLPDGTVVELAGEAWAVAGPHVLRWTPFGYDGARTRPGGDADVLTPPSLVAVLAAGWRGELPLLHPSALTLAGG